MADPNAPPPRARVLPPRHPVKVEDPQVRAERDRIRQEHILKTVRQSGAPRDASDPLQMTRPELIEAMVSAVTNRVRAEASGRSDESIREALLSLLGAADDGEDDGQQPLGLETPEIPAAEAPEAETGPEVPADPETPPTGENLASLADPDAGPALLSDREINADLEALGIEVDPTLSTDARLALRNEARAKRDAYPNLTPAQETALDRDGDGKPGGSPKGGNKPRDPAKAALAKLARGKSSAPKE